MRIHLSIATSKMSQRMHLPSPTPSFVTIPESPLTPQKRLRPLEDDMEVHSLAAKRIKIEALCAYVYFHCWYWRSLLILIDTVTAIITWDAKKTSNQVCITSFYSKKVIIYTKARLFIAVFHQSAVSYTPSIRATQILMMPFASDRAQSVTKYPSGSTGN